MPSGELWRGGRATPPPGCVLGLVFLIYLSSLVTATGRIAFMDHDVNSSLILTQQTLDFSRISFRIAFSFLSCKEGQILYQKGSSGDFFSLFLQNSTIYISWKSGVSEVSLTVAKHLVKNSWHFVDIFERTGDMRLRLDVSGIVLRDIVIANNTVRNSVFRINLSGNPGIVIGGRKFTGCVMEGPYILFNNNPHVTDFNVVWNNSVCPLSSKDCTNVQDIDDCWNSPCLNGGTCNDLVNAYSCKCTHLYNGTNCENDLSIYGCSASPCLHQGTCLDQQDGTRNYKCFCPDGFKGINCEISINECASGPCLHGTCIDGVNTYTCNCTGTGFTGTTCEQDIDECNVTSICGTGSCFNNIGSYSCSCPTGFDGDQCQNDINDCSSSPCLHGATCTDGVASYQCICPLGYEGSRCETNTDDCKNVQCSELHTICVDGINSHSCECKPGFTGSPGSCVDIDECNSSPCRNRGTCHDLENAFNCTCAPGYSGHLCQSDINECSSSPCKNGATCLDSVNSYSCVCVAGFTGTDCETDINECVTNNQPCQNNAMCVNLVNDYRCDCVAGWTGRHCSQDIDDCAPNPCQNGATCHNNINYYNCTCLPGYDGINCENNIDDCSPDPCLNGGTCNDLVNGYTCDCGPNWMGKNCSLRYDACSFQPCKNGATCLTSPPLHNYSCACVSGFTDKNCSTNINDCQADSCTPPFQCYDLVNNFTCACPIGYTGVNCSVEIKECESNPCKNGGTCEDLIGNYTCKCHQAFVNLTKYGTGQKLEFLTGYKGRNCEIDIDECALRPSICLNNGTCRGGTTGDYFCQCGPDINGIYTTGKNCELRTSYCESSDIVKDDPPACKNGGTCISGDRTFSCICVPGFTGPRCETNIDECESNPCQYNGTCDDGINGYTCSCIPGITGLNCETDINECASSPCLNHGQCKDKINGYVCNCTDTGFNGTECQFNIDDCAILQPCQNNASCTDLIKDYQCNCFLGYTGKDCQIDIDECVSNPCQFNGTCTQRSIQSRPDFSYQTAAGYDCACIPGITGVNCEVNIDECVNNTCQFGSTCIDGINGYTCKCAPGYRGDMCQNEINECLELLPCQNGAICNDKVADYDCVCPEFYQGKQYGGKNCTVELTVCENNLCENGATCKPYLVDEATNNQSYTCACLPGYTGDLCQTSTTMTFSNSTFIKYTYLKAENNTISLRFRTTLSKGLIFSWDGQFLTSKLFSTVELFDGKLYVTYPTGETSNARTESHDFGFRVNDSNWHEIKVVQTNELHFELISSKCSSNCKLKVNYTIGAPLKTISFGKPGSNFKALKTVSKSSWIGCMEDIKINSLVIVPGTVQTNVTQVNVEDNCPRSVQCTPDSCSRKGTCIDLWNKYRCVCYRPYYGNDCEKSYTAATFSKGGADSWTSFDISGLRVALQTLLELSFFFRTREMQGLMMYIGDVNRTFITLELYQGYILSRVVLCDYQQAFFINETRFDDGNQHLTRVKLEGGTFTLNIDSYTVSESVSLSPSCQLTADHLYIGGKIPDTLLSGRKKRSSDFTININQISDLSNVGKYKGTIQDIELNSEKLLLYGEDGGSTYVANNTSSLERGEVTDDICSFLPCENNATCANVFFNDFQCTCPHGFIGKNCSELDFCKDNSCPASAECHTLPDGFECISTATFSEKEQSIITFTKHINSNLQVHEISLKLRTIVRNGHILFIKNENDRYIKTELIGGNVIVTCKLDNTEPQEVEVDLFVADKSWYMVTIKDMDKTLSVTVSQNGTEKMKTNSTVLSNKAISLHTLINYPNSSPNITLGYTSIFGSFAHHYYSGCLREVRIGGILLPFYKHSKFVNFTTAQYFKVFGKYKIQDGCLGGNGCNYNQCKHGTSCLPDYYGYQCNCTGSGYQGNWCQMNINDCEEGVCYDHFNQGKCVDKVNDFYCKCHPGFSGNRCQTAVCKPSCANGQCMNGKCYCGSTHVGQACEIEATATCSTSPCRNSGQCTDLTGSTPQFNCSCQTGFTGYLCEIPVNYCEDLPCENGGNCTSLSGDYQCTCPQGFTGKNCSTDIDDCAVSPCRNGGTCKDMVNGYICNCTEGWDGKTCEVDVDECLTQPCVRGVCKNNEGSFLCDCQGTGYQGQYCDEDLDECLFSPCQNNGSCFNYEGGYNCSCSLGYEGKNCSDPNCSLVTCQNGTCNIDNSNKWKCNCQTYYFGQLCELKGPCADKPCNPANTKQCYQEDKVNGNYNCSCHTGWTGDICDTDVDECLQNYCQHSSTCKNIPGDYICNCPAGYTDKNCATNINDCSPDPCENGGICSDKVNDFYCDCNATGYTNKTCSDDINECDIPICQQFTSCINKPGDYTCICTPGYEGKQCNIKDPFFTKIDNQDDIMWYIVGPIVAVILIAVVVGIIVFVMCARSKRATRGTYSPSRQEVTGSRVELGQVLKPPPEERLI